MKTRIQDVREFEDEIAAKVEEYLQEKDYYECPVMTIGHEDGELVIDIDEMDKVQKPEDYEQYSLLDLIRKNDNNEEEPDYDRIDQVANEWIFIEH